MENPYLWQDPAFPHFYSNPAVVAPLEASFKQAVTELDARISKQNVGFADVLTEEIVSNSEIEGVLLDRESVHSSFVENIIPAREKELGAVQLARMALKQKDEPLNHERLFEMHRAILLGASGFPEESIGAYVGDMRIVSGARIDREPTVIHEGVSKAQVHDKIDRPRFEDIEARVAFGADHKIRTGRLDSEQPGEIEITTIKNVGTSGVVVDLVHEVDVVNRPFRTPAIIASRAEREVFAPEAWSSKSSNSTPQSVIQ